ncbi:Transposase, IS5 family [Halalkaliarchaeum sp. AArc-CO]|nr:Transposase, IS5 family [Halalkaliarchaeum sp. AArc-CO]
MRYCRRKRRDGMLWYRNSVSSRVLRWLRLNQLSLTRTNPPTPKGVAGSPSGRCSRCMHSASSWANPTASRWICSVRCPVSSKRSALHGFLTTLSSARGLHGFQRRRGVRFSADAPRNALATPPSIRLASTATTPVATTPTARTTASGR